MEKKGFDVSSDTERFLLQPHQRHTHIEGEYGTTSSSQAVPHLAPHVRCVRIHGRVGSGL